MRNKINDTYYSIIFHLFINMNITIRIKKIQKGRC